jgi:hypothetical protein
MSGETLEQHCPKADAQADGPAPTSATGVSTLAQDWQPLAAKALVVLAVAPSIHTVQLSQQLTREVTGIIDRSKPPAGRTD